MICGGSEASIHPLVFHSMNKLSTLCNDYADPQTASRPFDKRRNGFVIGEGSGVLVLEELSHAEKRGAKIYCEIVGYSCVSDGFHLTRPTDDGEGGFRSMMNAFIENSISPYDIDLVNCHATSTESGDVSELNALKNLFGNEKYKDIENLITDHKNYEFNLKNDKIDNSRLKKLRVNANKSQIGHLLAAAGSVELIYMILSMSNVYYS
jgi:3-oxoacyl-(acyl-carrier-protein) synthase